jgi:hypothetical protein
LDLEFSDVFVLRYPWQSHLQLILLSSPSEPLAPYDYDVKSF